MKETHHLLLLDALRGVAALIVIWYHCYEGFATSVVHQTCNHGYLAVDFFFILSGFVIGYAYDGRFQAKTMTTGRFFKRRLIRLHPMVIFGTLFGVLTFLIGGRHNWNGDTIPLGPIMLAMLLNLFLLPVIPGQRTDVRGNGEMFPLNGPHWSLFFEYIGNILYVLFLRRLPTWALALVAAVSGIILSVICIQTGYLGIGWTLPDFWGGLVRMLFPYSAGMLLARLYVKRRRESRLLLVPSATTESSAVRRPAPIRAFVCRNAFLLCALLLLVLLPMPFVGSEQAMWTNGLYVVVLDLLLFPCLIWIAAEGSELLDAAPHRATRLYTLLGDLSYPLYAVHYPVMYLFYAHIGFPNVTTTMSSQWPYALAAVAVSLTVALVALNFYDKPLRRRLTARLR